MYPSLSPHAYIYAVVALPTLLFVHYVYRTLSWRRRSRGKPLPPGPQGLPIIGNLFDIPSTSPWQGYRDLCVQYGDMLHLRTLGQSLIILGSYKVMVDLMEKRSHNYSDRPQTPMFELIGWEFDFGFMPYGNTWRRHRRLFWQHFHPGVIHHYQQVQRDTSRNFIRGLLSSPEQLEGHIRHAFGSSILKVVYGIEVAERGDIIIEVIDLSMEGVAEGLTPGAFLVEYLPFLRHVPEWFPGAGFQKKLRRWRDASHAMVDIPFARAQESMKREDCVPSLVSKVIRQLSEKGGGVMSPEDELILKNVAAIAYAGGADTTISTFQTFFLAMSLYPEVCKKAQAELLAVVGPDRLPDHPDRPNLPYVNAVIKECLRWQNATPLGIPHAVLADDEYDGYFIPAGAVVFVNTWAILHDWEAYPDPERFHPDRFLKDGSPDPSVRDPAQIAFGFGRRVCPGRYFAEASLFINIARVLHVFDITAPRDEHGAVIHVEPKMKDGVLSYPEDWRCTIKPRSAQATSLIVGD